MNNILAPINLMLTISQNPGLCLFTNEFTGCAWEYYVELNDEVYYYLMHDIRPVNKL